MLTICLSKLRSYAGNNSSCAERKYEVSPIIRRLNLSILVIIPVSLLINILINSSNVSGNAVVTVNEVPFA